MNAHSTPVAGVQPPRRTRYAALLCGALALGMAVACPALATPGSSVTPQVLALGELPEAVRAKFKADGMGGFENGTDVAQIVAIRYTVAPGGYFGWHRHGGPVWVVVAEGTLTLYDADDATCTGTDYELGSAFLDPGDHVHNARNEGTADVVVYATFMIPAGGQLRVDAPDPMVCPF